MPAMLRIYRINLSKKMQMILEMKMMILLKIKIKTQIMRIQVLLMLPSKADNQEITLQGVLLVIQLLWRTLLLCWIRN